MPKIIKHNSYLRRERERERERVNGISLFSNVGIDEIFLKRNNINIVGANELCKDRADFYRHVYPKCNMVCGDITNKTIFNKLIEIYKNNQCEFLLATPPCQGMSIAGKMNFNDERNSLITYVVNFIKKVKPKNILIENVPNILKFPINVDGKSIKIIDYIRQNLLPLGYKINASVLDAADFLTPQHRKRAIILLSKNQWNFPKPHKLIVVRDAIGHLPSIESNQISPIKWHYAKKHNLNHVLWMKNTPTGKSALNNTIFYPINKNGQKIKGFATTYKRIEWKKPAPTITMCNGAISSQNNVHPGNLKDDGTYSDARALSILEIMLLCGIPENWNIPKWASDNLIRKVIGECFPPKFCECLIKEMPR